MSEDFVAGFAPGVDGERLGGGSAVQGEDADLLEAASRAQCSAEEARLALRVSRGGFAGEIDGLVEL